MKKLITTCVLLTSVTMVSLAQSKTISKAAPNQSAAPTARTAKATAPTAEQYAERAAKAMKQQFGLDEKQYTAVYQAELDYQKQVVQARDGGYELGEGQSMQMKMGRDQRFQSVMTAAQYTKYQATQAKN
jgi:hypothetical protein